MDLPLNVPRLLWAGAAVGVVCLFALLLLPPVAAIPVYLLAPAGVALLLAGGSSQAYVRIGLIGCVVAGLESAIWIGALSNERVIATVIGAIVSFAILSIVGAFVCYVVGRVVFRGAGRS